MKTVRCAIYTRKSSEDGLEQDFNSLDAQREACAAYILSQASEGWKLIPEHYDDGGLSGGTLERPALQRLLGDVREGRIDIIVVYKVDRLTRSLLDFSKLVETFDASGVSFVSVTQSFNTTTSMGRLTLNMLLSFAQFEREVTAERIRDKIAQSKARGMWMGGLPPLGYEPDGRSLRVVAEQADLVRLIFGRYRELGHVRRLAEALESEGIRSPARVTATGKHYGGGFFSRGKLYHLLGNPVYAGDIAHKGKIYPGNHPAIIAREQWDEVQQQLTDNIRGTRQGREASAALLAGRLFDHQGEPLIPVHTSKAGPDSAAAARRRYRYYVSKAHHHDPATQASSAALRIPAQPIEQVVRSQMAELLADPLAVIEQIGFDLPAGSFADCVNRLEALRQEIAAGANATLRKLLDKVVVYPDRVELALSTQALADLVGLALPDHALATLNSNNPVQLRRSGNTLRLVDERGVAAGRSNPDPTLTSLLVQAHRWWGELSEGNTDVTRIAEREGVSSSWVTRVVRLAFLAPAVTDAILQGKAPVELDGRALLATGAVTADWREQAERSKVSEA